MSAPLFDEPPPRDFGLSRMHARARGQATYRPSSSKQPCDECMALQHETSGGWGSRAPVRHVRETAEKRLLLCGPHAQLWRERDTA